MTGIAPQLLAEMLTALQRMCDADDRIDTGADDAIDDFDLAAEDAMSAYRRILALEMRLVVTTAPMDGPAPGERLQ